MEITPEFISRFTTLPLGLPWSKDEKPIGQAAKKNFFQNNETPVEDKNGIRRVSIPYRWDEVIYQVIKYISCDGRHNIICGYHFKILHDLRYGMDNPAPQKLSIPYFLLQSLIDSSTKVQARDLWQLAHHGLIKFLVEEALHTFTLPIEWEVFQNMTDEDDIKALTYYFNPTVSEEEEQQGGEDEASGDIVEQERMEEGKESLETLEREVVTTLTALSTPGKQKQKRKRKTSMYFRVRNSTTIKIGKP